MRPVSLITGASRGLGRATALSIARNDGDVIITYKSRQTEAEDVVAQVQALGGKAVALALDVGNVASFPAFASQLQEGLQRTWQRGQIDHLINNAGHGEVAPSPP
ncbi:MAG: Glucose 1-dehydrogenase 1 [Stenotrophomonas maltophilia]|uniref:Glucose 1-dehydrogenase 1 n=1 Tax=Stenotrophomonas maltophilia TaxID=40324 RepID=A0A7V8FGA0_STEMA|nr:MAG: Glucose 1-dehydrogenase 1 [Stenotrophomonas maltophilia]